ncbi:hypothetical protein GGX14DRAFT_419634 [Mycena pura]|uniref:Uncharacterized protein n=1 Tax=Mycena pura TaxID=153505 RepID=A0AAD6YSA6_9AGAR|nr:hypothetical protein GGX14DRAFT_419634 [Mycena pura]
MFRNTTGFELFASEVMNAGRNITTQGSINIQQMLPHPMAPVVGPGHGLISPPEVMPMDRASNPGPPPVPPPPFITVDTTPSSQDSPGYIYSESELYCHQLLRQKRGFPLYDPKPRATLPQEYRRTGIAIGDVGRVTPEGGFDFFFNIYLPAEHPINANDVPDAFSPLPAPTIRDLDVDDHNPGDSVSTPSVQENETTSQEFPGSTFHFRCFGPRGAVLALPYGAHLEKLDNIGHLRRYMAEHAQSWYKYANVNRGRELVNGTLCLVTGWEKAPSYGMACFQHVSPQTEFQLCFLPTTDAISGYDYQYRWHGGPVRHKQADRPLAEGAPLNLTTFIHAFTISLGESLWAQICGSVQTSQLVDWQPEQKGSGFVPHSPQGPSFSWLFNFFGGGTSASQQNTGEDSHNVIISSLAPISRIVNPSQVINEHLMRENPQATVVITHDDDWRDILHEVCLPLMRAVFLMAKCEATSLAVINRPSSHLQADTPEMDLPEQSVTILHDLVDDEMDSQHSEDIEVKQSDELLSIYWTSHRPSTPPPSQFQPSSPSSLPPPFFSHTRSGSEASGSGSSMPSPYSPISLSPDTDSFVVRGDSVAASFGLPEQKQTVRRHSLNLPVPPRSGRKARSHSSDVSTSGASIRDSLNAENLAAAPQEDAYPDYPLSALRQDAYSDYQTRISAVHQYSRGSESTTLPYDE